MLTAIEAASAALRALELAKTLTADRDEEQRRNASIVRALDRMHEALAELRAMDNSSAASAGFVLPARVSAGPVKDVTQLEALKRGPSRNPAPRAARASRG